MATIVAAVGVGDNVILTDTSFGLADPDVPATGFKLHIDSEEMWCYRTSSNGKQLRVRRAVDGTTAATHASGATVVSQGAKAVQMYTKAGAISDSDFTGDLPPAGFVGFDTTNFKFYVRISAGVWKASAALT